MKKFLLSMVLIFCIGILSSCIVTEKYDEYERKQFSSTDDITKIIVIDFSTNYTILSSDTKELLVEYPDSPTESWYNISVSDGILKIEKMQTTVGVEDNLVTITLPEKEYQSISIETSNGDISFRNVLSENYKCYVKNGDIIGTLNGSETDYLIVTDTKNGESYLKNNVIESSKTIEFNVENGDIKVDFLK